MRRNNELEDVTRQIDRMTVTERTGGDGGRQVAVEKEERLTFKRILVGYDGSERAEDALAWAMWIAKAQGSEVLVALVLPPTQPIWSGELTGLHPTTAAEIDTLLRNEEQEAGRILKRASARLETAGVRHETLLVKGHPGDEFARLSEERDADLVVVGPHAARGPAYAFLGSVAEAIRGRVQSSVLIARTPPPPKRVLLAVDGSRVSRRAAAFAAQLVPEPDGALHVLHVLPLPFGGFLPATRDVAPETLRALEDSVRRRLGDVQGERVRYEVSSGQPAERILRAVEEEKPGLVVVGARGLSRVKGRLLGSVSSRVSQQAPVSVLLVKVPVSW